MKQSYVQRFKCNNMTRHHIAGALEKIAKDLRKEPRPDLSQQWDFAWYDTFELRGYGDSMEGEIRLSVNLS